MTQTAVAGVDWEHLRREAQRISANSYSPYSNLEVGAAGLTGSGRTVVGCNVENASYGLTLCAECSLVADLHRHGDSMLVAVSITGNDSLLMPCGRCRQLLFEAGGAELLIDADPDPVRLGDLLPRAFGPHDLPE